MNPIVNRVKKFMKQTGHVCITWSLLFVIKRYIAMLLVITMLPMHSITADAVQVIGVSDRETQTVSTNLPEVIEQEYILQKDWTLTQDEYVYAMKIEAGTLDLNGYTLTVLGDVVQMGGEVKINGGTLHVNGDYRIQGETDSLTGENMASAGTLTMIKDEDLVTVSGNFIMDSSVDHEGKLSAGTMELHGDFVVYNTKSNKNFYATKEHTIHMCGKESQKISFSVSDQYDSKIANLILEEKVAEDEIYCLEGVPCVVGRIMDRTKNTTIKGWLGVIGNPVFENGFYKGDICAVRSINIKQPLSVSGNIISNESAGLYLMADMEISGDIRMSGAVSINKTHLSVGGDVQLNAGLDMQNPEAKMTVSGNFICEAKGIIKTITDGTIEVYGDFIAKSGFVANRNNQVILCGTQPQTVAMAQGLKFAILELRNVSPEGVFVEDVFVKDRLITNGCRVTYLNGTGEIGWVLKEDTIWKKDLVLLDGELNLNGHKLCVQGDFLQKGGTVNISGGNLQILGDYRMETEQQGVSVGELRMQNESDRVSVSGNFVSRTNKSHEGLLTDGLLDVKGDFLVYKEDYEKSFYASGDHTVILSGESKQTVTLESGALNGNGLQNLTVKNQSTAGITFTGVIPVKGKIETTVDVSIEGRIGLGADAEIYSGDEEFGYYKGDVDLLTGYVVDRPLKIDGNLNTNVYGLTLTKDLIITGDLMARSNIAIEEASLTIEHDFNMSSNSSYADGISMQHATDRIYVGGDFSYYIPIVQSLMTDGVLEIKGDVTLSRGFCATGNHKILLSGDTRQVIDAGADQTIAILEVANYSQEGVLSKYALNVREIITNGCRFRYENVEGITGFCLQNDMTVPGTLFYWMVL